MSDQNSSQSRRLKRAAVFGTTTAMVLCGGLFTATTAAAESGIIHVDCTAQGPGDGSQNSPFGNLVEAVELANSNDAEDEIRISSGECAVGAVLEITEGLTLTGSGSDAESGTLLSGAALSVNEVDLTLQNFAIDAAGTGAVGIDFSNANLAISDVAVQNAGDDGIRASFSADGGSVEIAGSLVSGSAGDGITIHADEGVTASVSVMNTEATANGGVGIRVASSGATTTTLTGNAAHENSDTGILLDTQDVSGKATITHNAAGANGNYGISTNRLDGEVSIIANLATGNTNSGIYMPDLPEGATATIAENTTTDNKRLGLHLGIYRSDDTIDGTAVLTDNDVSGNLGDGVYVGAAASASITYSGGSLDDNGDAGLAVWAEDDAQISINDVTSRGSGDPGLWFGSVGDGVKIDVSNVVVDGSVGPGVEIITLLSGDITLRNSTVTGSGSEGIILVPSKDGTLASGRMLIDSTAVTGNGASGILQSTNGPVALTVAHSTISNNGLVDSHEVAFRDGLMIDNEFNGDVPSTVSVVNSTFSNHPNGSQINAHNAWNTKLDVQFATLTAAGHDGISALRVSGAETTVTHSILDNGESEALAYGAVDTRVPNISHTLVRTVTAESDIEAALSAKGSNLLNEDPQLAALADNGGGTLTHLPAVHSPVVDSGLAKADYVNAPTQDQRGEARFSGVADLGAVELVPEDTGVPEDPEDTITPGEDGEDSGDAGEEDHSDDGIGVVDGSNSGKRVPAAGDQLADTGASQSWPLGPAGATVLLLVGGSTLMLIARRKTAAARR